METKRRQELIDAASGAADTFASNDEDLAVLNRAVSGELLKSVKAY